MDKKQKINIGFLLMLMIIGALLETKALKEEFLKYEKLCVWCMSSLAVIQTIVFLLLL